MKTTLIQKLAIVGEVVTELSAGGLIIVQLVVMGVIGALLSGSAQLIDSLPNWALAVAGGGAACLMVSAFLLKLPKLFFVPAGMVALLAVQIGSAGVLISPDEPVKIGKGHLPSFAYLVNGFSWVVVIALALGGLVAIGILAASKSEKIAAPK